MNKYIISASLALVVFLGIIGAYHYPVVTVPADHNLGAVGDTNSTQRIASCSLDMSTTTASTITSSGVGCLFNGDTKDRVITSVEYFISGIASANTSVATTTWLISTSTNIYTGSTGYVLNTSIATTTGNGVISGLLYVASSTPGATATFVNRVWPSGTYLDLYQNASSSAVATIKVTYFLNN